MCINEIVQSVLSVHAKMRLLCERSLTNVKKYRHFSKSVLIQLLVIVSNISECFVVDKHITHIKIDCS